MKKSSLSIIREVYDPHNDFYILLGKSRSGKKTIAPFVVGFCHRSQDEVTDIQRFMDYPSATDRLDEIVVGQELPDDNVMLFEDWLQNDVYEWEEKFIEDFSSRMTRQAMNDLVREVCADLGMRAPRLVWTRPKPYSYYDSDDHCIYMGHRDRCTLLHELAHAYMSEKLDGPEDHTNHCPAFVWKVIELYNRYAGLSLDYLVTSANGAGILGPLDKETLVAPLRQFNRR